MTIETLLIEGIATPVSRIGLGTWAIGGWMWGGADDDRSVTTIRSALERGINLIDTAPVYGFGHSEEVVGKALEGVRDQAVIATKVALDWSEGGRAAIRRLRASVRKSKTRCVGYAPTASICTRCIGQTHWSPLSKPRPNWKSCARKAKF